MCVSDLCGEMKLLGVLRISGERSDMVKIQKPAQ